MTDLSVPEELALPSDFRQRIADTFGTGGRIWLDDLRSILMQCAMRWSLTIGPPVQNLSYNFVAPATRADGRATMLKVGVPHAELNREILALKHYNGRGSVRLLDADPAIGAILLEQIAPGRMLSELFPDNDEEATRIAARIMKRLWRQVPVDHGFITVTDWARGFQRLREHFDGGTGPFPISYVNEAEAIYERYLAAPQGEVLLHGDLHHFNILSSEREDWLAIDPKGIVGEPAYEVGALFRNPIPEIEFHPEVTAVQARRLDILAEELQIARRRLQEWAIAQIVLSAWWTYEDEGYFDPQWMAMTEALRAA